MAQGYYKTDRWLASGARGERGEEGGVGLAWVRCGAESYLPAPLGPSIFVRILALFLFPSFPKLYRTSLYSDFRVYLSDFA